MLSHCSLLKMVFSCQASVELLDTKLSNRDAQMVTAGHLKMVSLHKEGSDLENCLTPPSE